MGAVAERSLEELFEAFRARGDAAALAEVFDRTAPELLRVARHLARGEAEAEDLLQQCFLVAIERARRFDARRGLVPWLVGILANRARLARRRGGRSVEAWRLGERASDDPARAAEREEFERSLREGIGAVPEPYRSVLERHLLEEREPIEIARELDRAPGTVRMQLARGLERLRRLLPAGALAGGAVLAPRARGLSSVRAAVLARAEQVGPASALGGSIATIGGVLVSTKLVVGAAAALCVAALAWWKLDAAAIEAMPPAAVTELAGEPAIENDALAEDAGVGTAASEAQRAVDAIAASEAKPARSWWIRGVVRGYEPSVPLEVNLVVQGQPGLYAHAMPLSSGAYELDLAQALDRLPAGYYDLTLDAWGPKYRHQQKRLRIGPEDFALAASGGSEHRLDFEVEAYRGFTGRVVDEHGAPVEDGWVVLLSAKAGGPAEFLDDGRCSADRDFELATTARGAARLVHGAQGRAPATIEVAIPERGFVALDPLVLAEPGAEIRGRLELPASIAELEARVEAKRVFTRGRAPKPLYAGAFELGGRFELAEQRARVASDGSFVLGGLEAGERYEIRVASLMNRAGVAAFDPIVATAPAEGLLLGPELGAIEAQVEAKGREPRYVKVDVSDGRNQIGLHLDEHGVARFLVQRAKDYRLGAETPAYERKELELPAAGRERECRVSLEIAPEHEASARLEIEANVPEGEPLPGLTRFTDLEDLIAHPPCKLEREGERFVDAWIPSGRTRIHLEPRDGGTPFYCASYLRADDFEVELEPGAEQRVSVRFVLGGRIRVRAESWTGEPARARISLFDANGVALPMRSFYVQRMENGDLDRGTDFHAKLWLPNSAELYPNLPPGRYEVRVETPGYACAPVWVTVEPGRTVDAVVALRPE